MHDQGDRPLYYVVGCCGLRYDMRKGRTLMELEMSPEFRQALMVPEFSVGCAVCVVCVCIVASLTLDLCPCFPCSNQAAYEAYCCRGIGLK